MADVVKIIYTAQEKSGTHDAEETGPLITPIPFPYEGKKMESEWICEDLNAPSSKVFCFSGSFIKYKILRFHF